jgi:hypothetical protein
MGNGGTRQKPKKSGQAQSALPSGKQPQQVAIGEGIGAGGAGGAGGSPTPEAQDVEIVFEVCKLSSVVYLDAIQGGSVEVQKQNNDFIVLLKGKHLGNVPPDYEDSFSRSLYRGTIQRVSRRPQEVYVRVRL